MLAQVDLTVMPPEMSLNMIGLPDCPRMRLLSFDPFYFFKVKQVNVSRKRFIQWIV